MRWEEIQILSAETLNVCVAKHKNSYFFSVRTVCLEYKVPQLKAIKYTFYIFNGSVFPFLEFQKIVCM